MNTDSIKSNVDLYFTHRLEFYVTLFFKHLYTCDGLENDIEVEENRERSTPYNTMTNKGSLSRKS
jgi:hypothetical protein